MKKLVMYGITLSVIVLFSIAGFLVFFNLPAEANNIDYLENLPEKPDDFDIVRGYILDGMYPDLCDLENEYYLQPDFYTNWKSQSRYYDNHIYKMWGVYGYGTYPAEVGMQVNNLKQNEQIDICTLFRTGSGIETYQGVQLVPVSNEYFDVSINPSIFLLYPTFPKFEKDWVRKVKVTVRARKNVPIGEYVVGFRVETPKKDMENFFIKDVLSKDLRNNPQYYEDCIDDGVSDGTCEVYNLMRQKRYVSTIPRTGEMEFKLVIKVVSE